MIKFLCLITALSVSITAMAQTEQKAIPSLFEQETPADIEARSQEVLREVYHESEGSLKALDRNAAEEQKTVSKAEKGFFVFKPSEIQIVTPTVPRFAFCSSQLTLANHTEYVLKSLSVSIRYDTIDLPYTYKNLGIEDEQSGSVMLGGEACQALRSIPPITIKSCNAVLVKEGENGKKTEEEISEEECKSKVKYMMP